MLIFTLFLGLLSTQYVHATGLENSPWPTLGQNNKRTGMSPYDTSHVDGSEKWRFETGGDVRHPPAIGVDGGIYVSSDDGFLYALNPDGSEKWKFRIKGWVGVPPAICSDGTIYVGSWDHHLYAIHPDGSEKWRFETGGSVGSPAIGSDGAIYFGSNDFCLYAVNPDGSEKWRFETGGSVGSPAIGSDGTIYFGSDDFCLYAVNPDGSEKWRFEDGAKGMRSPTIGSDGTIYVSALGSRLYAVNPDGSEKWNFKTAGWVSHPTEGVSSDNLYSPAIGSDGTIYVSAYNSHLFASHLYAVNQEGTEKWRFETEGWVSLTMAIGSDGTIYFGSWDNSLYAVNQEGTEKWRFKTGDSVGSSPAIGSDGTIYFGSFDKHLYSLGMYKLVINKPVGQGTVEVEGQEVTEFPFDYMYTANTEIELTAVPDEHWYLAEWTGDYEGTKEKITIKMDKYVDITPVFKEKEHKYTLNVIIEGSGSVKINPDRDNYELETKVNLTVESNKPWYFIGWSGDSSEVNSSITVTMDSDKNLTAHFVKRYVLSPSVNPTGGGSISLDPPGGIYDEGTLVTVTVYLYEDFEFNQWSGAISGEELVVEIEMNSDLEVTANLIHIPEQVKNIISEADNTFPFLGIIGSIVFGSDSTLEDSKAAYEDGNYQRARVLAEKAKMENTYYPLVFIGMIILTSGFVSYRYLKWRRNVRGKIEEIIDIIREVTDEKK